MAERKPFITTPPTNDAIPPFPTMEEYIAQEQARDRKLGPEVKAADARTRAEYDAQRKAEMEPTPYGNYETQVWRDKLRQQAQVAAQGLDEDMPENPVQNGGRSIR